MHGHIAIADAVNTDCSLCDGLVSWWACLPDQQRGLYWRDLCRRNEGTLTGMDPPTDWLGPQGRPGGFGRLNFDRSDDYVAWTPPALTPPFTVAMWARSDNSTVGNQAVFGLSSTASSVHYHLMRFNKSAGSHKFVVGSNAGGGLTIATSTTTTGPDIWHFLTGVWRSDSDRSAFIDGGGEGNNTTTRATTGIDVGRIGNFQNNLVETEFFGGDIDDVFVWQRALSVSEILAVRQDSLLDHPRMWNWIEPRYYVSAGAAPGGTNPKGVFGLALDGPLRRVVA